jgi:hypothetical protein
LSFSLLQVFDLTGQRLYQNEWDGHEIFAAPAEDPEAFNARNQDIEAELLLLRKQDRALALEMDENPTKLERDDIREQSREIWHRRDSLQRELNELPLIDDIAQSDFTSYKRRVEVETILREAFLDKHLVVKLIGSSDVRYDEWIIKRRFIISFSQSIVIPPASIGNRQRRCPAYVSRAQFNEWLERFAPDPVAAGELTAEEQCRLWLRTEVDAPKKNMTKLNYLNEAQNLFPQLSKRAFDRQWADVTPKEWKRAGKRPLTNQRIPDK